jgi:hypothetical protein
MGRNVTCPHTSDSSTSNREGALNEARFLCCLHGSPTATSAHEPLCGVDMQNLSVENVLRLASSLSTDIDFGPRSDPVYVASLLCNSSAFAYDPRPARFSGWSDPYDVHMLPWSSEVGHLLPQ